MGGGAAIRLLRRLDFWVLLLGGGLLILTLVLGAGLEAPEGGPGDLDPAEIPYSTYNTTERGLKAIYLVMESRGAEVVRWRRPLRALDAGVDRLVVWEPDDLAEADWKALDGWVRQGGTLVISTGLSIHPLVPEAGSFLMTQAVTGGGELLPRGVSPLVLGVLRLQGERPVVLQQVPFRSGMAVHAVTTGGLPAVVSWGLGKGEVYLVTDPALLANGWLLRADNLIFAVNLLTPGPGKTLGFDEHHHGAAVASDWWQTLRPPLRWTALQTLLAAVLLLAWAGARLGRPVEVPEGISRQAVEFVHGLAAMLRDSRGARWVLGRLAASFRAALGRYLGAPPTATGAELARLWHLHTGEPAEPLETLLNRCAESGAISDNELTMLARQMSQYRRRIRSRGGTGLARSGSD